MNDKFSDGAMTDRLVAKALLEAKQLSEDLRIALFEKSLAAKEIRGLEEEIKEAAQLLHEASVALANAQVGLVVSDMPEVLKLVKATAEKIRNWESGRGNGI